MAGLRVSIGWGVKFERFIGMYGNSIFALQEPGWNHRCTVVLCHSMELWQLIHQDPVSGKDPPEALPSSLLFQDGAQAWMGSSIELKKALAAGSQLRLGGHYPAAAFMHFSHGLTDACSTCGWWLLLSCMVAWTRKPAVSRPASPWGHSQGKI